MTRNIFVVLVFAALMMLSAVVAVPVQAQERNNYFYGRILNSPDPQASAWFGSSVAVSGNLVVVGEFLYDMPVGENEGRAWIYNVDTMKWTELTAQEPQKYGWFGYSVAVSGNLVVVGEPIAKGSIERVHIFDTAGNRISILTSPTSPTLTDFGFSVATGGNLIVVGEPGADVVFDSDEGRAHIYRYIPPPVGGEIAPISSLALLASWIALAVAVATIGFAMSRRKLFLH